MTNNAFREYDIRGVIGKEIELNNVKDLTKSILTFFIKEKPNLKEIIVGMDGRTHSPSMKKEVIAACQELGIDVTFIGVCPSPVFYFTLFNTPIQSGLMITASHNPKEYNGIKICLKKKSVWGDQIREIRKIYNDKSFIKKSIKNKVGKISNYDPLGPYLDWMCNHFAHLKGKVVNAVIDCGNATAGVVLPKLIKMLDLKNTKLLFEEVDGDFPNHEADPTNPKNMVFVKKLLKSNSYEIGLGLDGDCDRMNPMTKSGYLVPGDKLLALYSKQIIKKHPGASIVFDIKSSDTLIQALKEMGARPCIAPSGHSIIKEHLYKNNAKLAGELSCHFFFNDRYFGYDDGIYAALRLFELLDESEESLEDMLEKLPTRVSSPEYRINCAEEIKPEIVEHVKTIFATRKDTHMLTIDGLRATTPYGWGLVRASNTQAVICLRFESDTQDGLQQLERDFTQALTPYFNEKELEKHFGK